MIRFLDDESDDSAVTASTGETLTWTLDTVTLCKRNLASLEGSIQNLLSVLYPPFEATAPTLLSQLFQIIDSRYKGDALRCLLDFLVPAKHILDTVQQAACAQYSDALFLCEGWPLCLRDRVVVHLAPVDPLLLQPGDFYLQVAPFCVQSARIVVCSLLEEEGFRGEVVEETPIPETSYPCIFSCDWLDEINHGRRGTLLSQCLLATEQGVVRLPWERVASPDFVEVPQSTWSSMASVPPPYLSSPSPLLPPPLPDFAGDSSPDSSFPPPPSPLPPPSPSCSSPTLSECVIKRYPLAIQKPVPLASSQSSAFSVETRICPAKHGIAVSLCLVGSSAASQPGLVNIKEAESESRPIGWVSPNTWDSRFTGTHSAPVTGSGSISDPREGKGNKGTVPEDRHQETNQEDMRRRGPEVPVASEGEYIDVLQATMLFGRAQSLAEGQQKSETQPHAQTEAQTLKHPQRRAQTQPVSSQRPAQREPPAHFPPRAQPQAHPPATTHCRSAASSGPSMSAEAGPPPAPHHSQALDPHCDSQEPSQCVRTVRFAEKPCTPCMRRRQGGKVSRAQELRCRYRDSYQAAIQNPVPFEKEKERGSLLALVEEDGDPSLCDNRTKPPGGETADPWCFGRERRFAPGTRDQFPSSAGGAVCEESGEKNTVPYWKPGNTHTAPCMGYRGMSASQFGELREQTSQRTALPSSSEAHSAKSYDNLHDVNGTSLAAGTRIKTAGPSLSSNAPKQPDALNKHCGLPFSSGDTPGKQTTLKTHRGLLNKTSPTGNVSNCPAAAAPPPSARLSDGRCSSLSTAVVDTSERCELVIVEGQNVRRRENAEARPEVPQLHVVKCKNSTAFRLVSPKINRRKILAPDAAPPDGAPTASRSCRQMESRPQAAPAEAKPTFSQPASARPRPDHLPLGSPDPGAHPVYLGVASLTGCRDRMGRAIVELYGDHQGWKSSVTSQELFQMLLYFHSIIRKEVREAGMTLIFDARKMHPQPQLYKALMDFQELCPQAVNSLVLVVDKESNNRPDRCPGIQTDLVTLTKSLLKLVDVGQLSCRLGGSLAHTYCDWTELHQKMFPFVYDLYEASSLLLRAISKLEEPQRTESVQAVQQCMMDQRTLMKDVLEDNRLVGLQREGGAILARLRKESDLKYPLCEDLSDAVDSVTSLYNHVEEQAHVLVQRSNMSLEHLEYLLQLREMEGHFTQIQQWFNVEGERHLLEAESVEDSGDRMEQVLSSFTAFLIEANDRRHHAMSLVSEAERLQQSGPSRPETEAFGALLCAFKSSLEDFLCRAETCGRELQIIVNVCDFCEQATALANECVEYLDQSHSRSYSIQDHESPPQLSQTNNQSPQLWSQDSGSDPRPDGGPCCQSDIRGVRGSGPAAPAASLSCTDGSSLQALQERFVHFSPERFQEMKAQAGALRGSRGMRVWNVAWLKCQEARQQLQERTQGADEAPPRSPDRSSWCEGHFVDVVSTSIQTVSPGGQSLVVQSTPGPRHPQWEGIVSGAVDLDKRRPILSSNSPTSRSVACCNIIIKPEEQSEAGTSQGSKVNPQSPPSRSAKRTERESRRRLMSRARSERDAAALSQSHTVGCQWFPWGRGLAMRSVSQDSCATAVATAGSSTPPEQRVRSPSSCSHHGQPSCRILQEAQKFQLSRHGSFCSDDSCLSDRGAAGGDGSLCCKHSSLPVGRYEGAFCLGSPQETPGNAQRLQRVMEELVITEREYVRSLGYILTHYLPLMDRLDIPQDLRGKRGVIFGNLEKLYDFHGHYFLPELEACQREPAMVARCFLRHSESFGLYALYSKNKPQSDALILHRRHDIFKKKQQELGDLMDLSSYLLRPIQRISKYSLLLQDMLALAGARAPRDLIQDALFTPGACAQGVCGPAAYAPDLSSGERERERAEIQAAADLVRFQMRHGNDLLTMDAIQDCDVNLKEQGQLIRQDEFTVFFRKKKCVRRVFLFEDLILFSKTKRTDVGNDVYVYKQSFKTSDIGMTHNSGMSALCFEIWFRRRKREDTYTLKASSTELKQAWTTDLERLLWDQATHSRELRMQERVFMGMGRKPFMDIQPSDAAICDRAISCALPGRIPVACCSHRGLEYPRPHSIGSGSTASTTLSQSSSSSGRGSLPPAGYPGHPSQGADAHPAARSSPEAAADNEINNLHLHQYHLHRHCEQWKSHRPLLDSTDSSGEYANPFSCSERSCLSAISGEVVDDSSYVSQSSQAHTPVCRTPSLRENGSPAATKTKPGG